MIVSVAFGFLGLLSNVVAHGNVRYLSVDGQFYWGYNPERDDMFNAKRIAFGYNQKMSRRFAIVDQTSPDMACNHNPIAPALIARARAGSQVNFMWNPWFAIHKGPLLTYMAPYDGAIEQVKLNDLKFFKISERGLASDNITWAVDEMMENGNVSSTIIPHDIKPGKYVLRHELIALHYATEDSLYHLISENPMGPQHYIQCFNIQIEGTGTSQPEGVKFPGAYKPFKQEPGLYFDIWRNVSPYPIPGPRLYLPKGPAPKLEPLTYSTIQSPTGSPETDLKYFGAMTLDILEHDAFTLHVNSKHFGDGPNPNMTGPPKGSVPEGSTIR